METNIPSKHFWRSASPSPPLEEEEEEDSLKGNNNSNNEIDVSMFSDVKYCYYLLEAMPLPGPTWSTTGPSVLAEPQSLATPSIEASVWGENQASSYAWWMGFLEGLDGNNMSTVKKLDVQFVENNNAVMMEHSKEMLSHESKFVDGIDLGCCPDDWLMIPPIEKDLGDIVVP